MPDIESKNVLEHLINNNFKIDPQKIKEELDKWKNAKLNLAFIGERGCGKSTIINSLRGLYPSDNGAAKIDIIECTSYPTPYPHPDNQNLLLWDLPGVNTPSFPLKEYLEKISCLNDEIRNKIKIENGIEVNGNIQFDCFIICCVDAFHETDLCLAKEIQQKGINFYFIRTQIDCTLEKEKTRLDKNLTESEENDVIERVKSNIKVQLTENLLPNNCIFAVSALMRKLDNIDNRNKYEFPDFQNYLINLFDKEKQNALILTLFPLAKEGMKLKCNALRKRIWLVSALSGAIGLSPIPGTSAMVDISLLVNETMNYIHQLKLSEDSIKQMAESFGLTYSQVEVDVIRKRSFFNSIISMRLGGVAVNVVKEGVKVLSSALFKQLAETIATFLAQYIAANVVEEFIKGILPGIGSVVGSILSFGTTFFSLQKILDNCEETLIEILNYCKQNRKK